MTNTSLMTVRDEEQLQEELFASLDPDQQQRIRQIAVAFGAIRVWAEEIAPQYAPSARTPRRRGEKK